MNYEKVAENYNPAKQREAQEKGWLLLEDLAAQIVPGTKESQARILCTELNKTHGAEKLWHRDRISFSKNTMLSFSEKPQEDPVLGENDIYFIDIGPVFEGYEADCGATYVLGQDSERIACAEAAEDLFFYAKALFKKNQLSGAELYLKLEEESQCRGWILNLSMDGHRIADFPHVIYYKGGLAEYAEKPSSGLWVLEVQIRHPKKEFGAFFEDIL